MKQPARKKVDEYSMGELSQLAGHRMKTQVKKSKKKYNRKNKDVQNEI
jgi:hypothetical protein